MTNHRTERLHASSLWTATVALCLVGAAHEPSGGPVQLEGSAPEAQCAGCDPSDGGPSGADARSVSVQDEEKKEEPPKKELDEEVLFEEMMAKHWRQIFPGGNRNVGGPQFFKYIYERLATDHELFKAYSRFYCGVSGAIVRPTFQQRYDVVKIKDNDGQCVVGKYYRCCWPCSGDIMKYARVEPATFALPKDPSGKEETYWVLTIGDPCHECDATPCDALPDRVEAYECKDQVTANALRVRDGKLTSGPGRLVFAVLHDAKPADETEEDVSPELLRRCMARINATPEQLEKMGGMGNIFVELALVNSDETFTNSLEDLCD